MFTKKMIIGGACALAVMSGGAFAVDDTSPPRADDDQQVERGRRGPGGEGRRGHKPPPFKDILDKHDTNADGMLQRSEAPDHMPEHVFERMDTNGDGVIDAAEGEKGQDIRGPRGKKGPKGQNKRMSAIKMFERMDTNKDDVVTRAEAEAFDKKHQDMLKQRGGSRGENKPPSDR